GHGSLLFSRHLCCGVVGRSSSLCRCLAALRFATCSVTTCRFATSTLAAFCCWLGEAATRLIGQVNDCARDFQVAKCRVAAAWRHGVNTVDCIVEEVVEALGDEWAPSGGIAQLRSACDASGVTGR